MYVQSGNSTILVPSVAFIVPSRSEESLARAMKTIRSAWPYGAGSPGEGSAVTVNGSLSSARSVESTDPPVCSLVGYSCVASARARLAAAAVVHMPPVDVVVMLDDDVWLSGLEMLSIVQHAWTYIRPTVVFATYPIRQPKGYERSDQRLAHYLDGEHVHGGLGCVAMRREVFEYLHTVPFADEPLVTFGGGAATTAPYRVGPDRSGKWLSEDLYFCARLAALDVRSVLHSVPIRHGSIAPCKGFMMLDGSVPPEFLLLSP
jgi:hypothetical protein